MIELDPCLAGCDSALAEAEQLLAVLGASGTDAAALAPVRASITVLRREVDRLRGLKVHPARRKTDPFWMQTGKSQSPWPSADPP